MNTRENFWNVYCFATNQMRDKTAKDNRQTTLWISHDFSQETTSWLFLLRQIFNFTVRAVTYFSSSWGTEESSGEQRWNFQDKVTTKIVPNITDLFYAIFKPL